MQLRHDGGPFLSSVSHRIIGTSTALSLLLWVSAGCGTAQLPPPETVPNQSTLGETVTSGPSETDGDDTLTPTGIEETPSLSFEAGPGFCCNPLSIEFRVALSDVIEFAPTSYRWDFGDGRTGTGVSTHHTYAWQGDYLVTLTVTTSDGVVIEVAQTLVLGSSSENGGITLMPAVDPASPENTTGELRLTVDAGSTVAAFAGDDVLLNGTADTGGQAVELAFQWRQLAGPTVSVTDPSRASISLSIPSNIVTPTELLFELTVTGAAVTASDQVAIVVSAMPGRHEVYAHAGADQTVSGGSVVHLDGSFSTGMGEEPLTFHWSQTTGPAVVLSEASSPVPSFVAPPAEANLITLLFDLTVTQGAVSAHDDLKIMIASIDTPDEEQILQWMKELEPLQKVHFTWPLPTRLIQAETPPLLFELVRLMNACSIRGQSPREHHVNAAVRVCKEVNALHPAIPTTIAIHFLPWEMIFPPDAPPTDTGPFHDAEIEVFTTSLLNLKGWVDSANQQFDADIPVSALIFDSERFWVKDPGEPGEAEWNAAITAKYNEFYTLGKSVFPDARIEWYGRGAVQPCRDITRWCPPEWFTLDEMGDTYNCALYYPYNTELMINTFRQTHQNAVAHGVSQIMLWVSLGAGWDLNRTWHFDLEYDVADSWALGAQINDPYFGDRPDEYAPWHDAPFVCFYPRAFNAATPQWGRHFVAYVRGAHGIDELP